MLTFLDRPCETAIFSKIIEDYHLFSIISRLPQISHGKQPACLAPDI
jgi:hypothetical protein